MYLRKVTWGSKGKVKRIMDVALDVQRFLLKQKETISKNRDISQFNIHIYIKTKQAVEAVNFRLYFKVIIRHNQLLPTKIE